MNRFVIFLLLVIIPCAAKAGEMQDCNQGIDAARSVKACTRIIEGKNSTTRLDAYVHRGFALMELKQYKPAAADFTRAISMDPQHLFANIGRGAAFYNLGKHQNAIGDFTNGIKLSPSSPVGYFGRARAYEGAGNHQRAIDDYSSAIERGHPDAPMFLEKLTKAQ